MIVFERPKALADVKLHYCPGCTHGIIHRLVAEAIDELQMITLLSGVGYFVKNGSVLFDKEAK